MKSVIQDLLRQYLRVETQFQHGKLGSGRHSKILNTSQLPERGPTDVHLHVNQKFDYD